MSQSVVEIYVNPAERGERHLVPGTQCAWSLVDDLARAIERDGCTAIVRGLEAS